MYATVADLKALLPDIDNERAEALLRLAGEVIDAYVTTEIPSDPVPNRVRLAAISLAARLASVDTSGQTIVQEAIPGYSVTLSRPTRPDEAFVMPREIKALLSPWGPSGYASPSLLGPKDLDREPGAWH